MRRRPPAPRRWRGQRPRGHAVERVAACAFACRAAPAETTARALGATWLWTTAAGIISDFRPRSAEVQERLDAGGAAPFECAPKHSLTDERHPPDYHPF